MYKPFLWIVDHPGITSLLLLLATAWFVAQLPRLEMDASAEVQMLKGDPDRAYYDDTKDRFGDDKLTVILVRANNVFSVPVLRAIREISAAVELLDGVKRVDSLSTVDHIKGEGDWLNIKPVLDRIPKGAAGLAQVREDALATPFFVNNLIADNAKAAAINVFLRPDAIGETFNTRFIQAVDEIIERETVPGAEIFHIGPPLTKVTIVDYIIGDWSVLLPAGALVVLTVMYFVFRGWGAVMIPLVTSAVSIVWGLGIMAVLGYAVNIVTSVIPSVLVIIGFTEDVHLISEYESARDRGEDKPTALRTMMQAMGLPVLITSITTAAGFGSLSTSQIRMFVELGHVAALAFVLNFFVTIIAVPAMLRFWPSRPGASHQTRVQWGTRLFLSSYLANLAQRNIHRRKPILVTAAVILVLSLLGLRGVRVDAGLLSHFKADSPLLERTRKLHEALSGALSFYVVVDTKERDGIKEPAILEKVNALQGFLSDTGMIDTTVSVADYIKKIHREMNTGANVSDVIPRSRDLIAQYLLLLDGPEISQLVDGSYAAANIVVRHNIINAWELSGLLEKLQAYIDTHFKGAVQVRYTGEDILLNHAAKQLSVTMVTGLSYTLLFVALINVLLFKSLTVGLLSLVPNALPVLSYLGLMGFIDLPLNTGTAMIAPIAVGIAVDDTVHYMVRYRDEHLKLGNENLATTATLQGEGAPIVTTSVGLAAGFLALLLSNFVTFIYFGVLAAFVMIIALLADLFLTPALMSIVKL